jgi:hypothetical protein
MAPVGQIDDAAANASCRERQLPSRSASDPGSGVPPCLVAIEHDRDVPAGEQLRPSRLPCVIAWDGDRRQPSRASADHVRRPLDEHDPLGRLGRGVGNQAPAGCRALRASSAHARGSARSAARRAARRPGCGSRSAPGRAPSHSPAPKASPATTHTSARRAARAVATADTQTECSPPEAAAHP